MSALTHEESDEDFFQLDRLVREFYRVICFEEGGAPDFERFTALFSRHARITRITPEGIDHLDVEGFSALVRELLEFGAFHQFLRTRAHEKRASLRSRLSHRERLRDQGGTRRHRLPGTRRQLAAGPP